MKERMKKIIIILGLTDNVIGLYPDSDYTLDYVIGIEVPVDKKEFAEMYNIYHDGSGYLPGESNILGFISTFIEERYTCNEEYQLIEENCLIDACRLFVSLFNEEVCYDTLLLAYRIRRYLTLHADSIMGYDRFRNRVFSEDRRTDILSEVLMLSLLIHNGNGYLVWKEFRKLRLNIDLEDPASYKVRKEWSCLFMELYKSVR